MVKDIACLPKAWNGKKTVALPKFQPYSQDDRIGYRNFSSGAC
jgi:hypothetical protein